MAADDQEKTEEPTGKKIEDAKKDGNVPKSQDISGFATLLVGVAVLLLMLGFIKEQFIALYQYYQSLIGQGLSLKTAHQIIIVTAMHALFIILPICISVAIAGVMSNIMQFGFIFTTKPITPNIEKINPIKGLKNLISIKKLIDTAKIIFKVCAVFSVAFWLFLEFLKELPHVLLLAMPDQLSWLKEKMLILAGVMMILLLVIAIIDLFIVRFQYFKDLRMSKQEVKDEFKQMEGDPQVKSRIRQLQMQGARRRMMSAVPTADVVITNPTHFAVALRYDKEAEGVPVVLAKGVDHLAMQIRKIAIEHDVEIVQNPPLARQLYKMCDAGDAIPENLFKAVADVLRFVYSNNKEKFKNKLNA